MGKVKRLCTMALAVTVAATTVMTGYAPGAVTVLAETAQKEFYVSAAGSDANPGTREKPFATIQKAQNEVRKVNRDMDGDILVNIGAGEYYIDEAIWVDERDSGYNGHQVIYRSADGAGKARVIGGDKITEGWTKTTNEDVSYDLAPELVGEVYKVQLDPEEYNFNALYVNGEKAVMARTKNYQKEDRFPAQHGEYLFSAGGGAQDIVYNEGDLDQHSINGMIQAQERGEKEIAQLYVWDGGDWDWFTSTLSLGSINPDARNIRAWTVDGHPEINRTKYSVLSHARYYLQGNLAFMDVPGEYHYNKSTGVLYYYPKEGEENLGKQEVVVPRTKEIFHFQGSDKPEIKDYGKEPNLEKQVSNITLDGLSLECTDFVEWISSGWNSYDASGNLGGTIPPEAEGSTNTSYCEQTDRTEFKIGAVTMINTNHLTVQNCKINNIGLFGIALWRDNTYNTVRNCEISNVGYGGITTDGGYPGIGKYNNNHLFTNLSIHDVGTNVGHGTGITVMSTGQSEFSHIEIYNAPRRAMMLSGGIRRNGADNRDGRYDEMTDMYTVGNTFEYFYVHHCEQDSGEDSAVYLCMLLRGNEIAKRHGGISDPLKVINPETGEPYGEVKANIFSQFLIDSIGSTPSMHDKNTVHGMDIAMGGSGTHLWNIKGTNQQSCTLRFEEANQDKLYTDNTNNNYKSDDQYNSFDDSRMEYDKIGLTEEYPFERYQEPDITVPEDVYFSDDFETGKNLNPRKWSVEKGNAYLSRAYMAEGPYHGSQALCIDGDQAGGVVVSRKFEQELNKTVTLKFFDKRLDYATSDSNEGASPTNIRPHSFVRVDKGDEATQIALGADGDVSKDYYLYKNGSETVQTKIHRTYGWHEFKFDYTSGTEVRLLIDGKEAAVLPADSFNYVAMGDWNGQGGKTYIDQFYIHGGDKSDPAEDLPLPKPPTEPDRMMYEQDFESIVPPESGEEEPDNKLPLEDWSVSGKGSLSKTVVEEENGGHKLFVQSPDNMLYYNQPEWKDYTLTCDVNIDGWRNGLETGKPWENFSAAVNYEYPESERQPNRNSLKFLRTGGFEMYRRTTGKDETVGTLSAQEAKDAGLNEVNPDHTGKTYKVEISNIDNQLIMKVDGTTLFEKKGNPLATGGVGFDGINVEYYLDNIKVVNAEGTTLFEEDFEGYSGGSEPEGPTEIVPGWKAMGKGAVTGKVEKDPEQEGNHLLQAQSQDNTFYYEPALNWANYTMECKVRLNEWGGGLEPEKPWDNFAVSFYVNAGGSANRYALKFNRTGGFEAYRRANGDTTFGKMTAEELGIEEANTNHTGQWYDIKIEAAPGHIIMSIDGKEAFNIKDSGLKSGAFGFDGINLKSFQVDDIKITASATKDPAADKEDGTYEAPLSVTLQPEKAGDQIFYTTDGTDPKDPEHGQYYIDGEPLVLEKDTELKFVAIGEGQLYSNVISRNYMINQPDNPDVPADKTALKQLIDQANEMKQNADRYVSGNWQKLLDALQEAELVFADEEAAEETIKNTAAELQAAIQLQKQRADKTSLQDAADKAKAVERSKYTEDSLKTMDLALEKVNTYLNDEQLSEEDQKQADEAAAELYAAINELKLKSSGGDNNNGNNNNGNGNNNNGNNNNGGGNKKPGQTPPVKTGDNSVPVVWGILLLAAISGGAVLARKKKTGK